MPFTPSPVRHHRPMAALWIAMTLGLPVQAEPRTPANDDEVLATLPQRNAPVPPFPLNAGVKGLTPPLSPSSHQSSATPGTTLPQAIARARDAIARARHTGDPRELGQAQAALLPWWTQTQAPPVVQWLRATIRQSLHEFQPARDDFDALLHRADLPPALHPQVLLSRAALHQTQGRLTEAQNDCQTLAFISTPGTETHWTAQVCEAELMSLQGSADHAAQTLAALAHQAPPHHADWIALVRAELAARRGDPKAGRAFAQAAHKAPTAYALAAYADWLLDHHLAREVIALLHKHKPDDNDALLLRLAIAYQQTRDPQAGATIAKLRERQLDADARGDSNHARERARFALDLDHDPHTALQWAVKNWHQQREPADALLLVRAAQATHNVPASTTADATRVSNTTVALREATAMIQRWQTQRPPTQVASSARHPTKPTALPVLPPITGL